jgi:hypothetical protein
MNSQKFARRFTSQYIIYIYIALFTFSLGYFVVFSFYTNTNEKFEEYVDHKSENYTKFEVTEIDGEWKLKPVKEFQNIKNINTLENPYPQDLEFRKPFCKDKRILPVWKLLQKEEYFKFQNDGQFYEPNCANMFEIFKFDLNRDGRKEIILRGKIHGLCGATGNCGLWIFGKKGGKYRELLSDEDYFHISKMGKQITNKKTKDYADILLTYRFSVSDIAYTTYKFDGQKYIESKCQVSTPNYSEKTTSKLKWHFVSCKRYFDD